MIPMIGPKWAMILMSVPAVGGFVCLIITKSLDDSIDPLWLFYVGRILTEFGGGAFSLAAPMYVSEIADARIRGVLGSAMQFQLTTGMCLVNALSINGFGDWMFISEVCAAIPGKPDV